MVWSFKNKEQNIFLTSIFFFFILSTILRYIALVQTPYANGWDGYYYIMQAHSWLTYGHLQSLDYSIIYPYFTLFSYWIGDFEIAYKIGAALLSGALISSAYILAYKTSKNNYASILVASFLLFSPTITFMVSQFPKNVLGLIVFNLFLTSFYSKNKLFVLVFLIISLFTHRMIAGLCVIVFLLGSIKYINLKWVLGGVAVIILVSLLPGVIHYSDFTRFSGQLNWLPQFAPWSYYILFKNPISYWWILELILLSIMIFHIIYSYIKLREYVLFNSFIIPVLILLVMFPFFKMDFGSMGYRFFMIAPVFVSIFFMRKIQIHKTILIGVSLFFVVSSTYSYKSYNPSSYDPPNSLYAVIINRLTDNYNNDDYPLVIVHKSLAEMIIYKTEFDALNWVPPETINPDSVLRIIHNMEQFHFSKYLSDIELQKFKKLSLHYYAAPESSWNKFLKLVEDNKDQKLMNLIMKGNNPLNKRPYFLKKGKNI